MKTIISDSELEFELQELYILSKHWMQDISFIEDEIRFFKTIFDKYWDPALINEPNSMHADFKQKITQQEGNIDNLKLRIREYLKFLEPFINDQEKMIDLSLIEKFNVLGGKIKSLFESTRQTKTELFKYAEGIIGSEKHIQ